MDAGDVVFGLGLITMISGALVGIYRTLNHWIERRHERFLAQAGATPPSADMQEIRDRLGTLDEIGYRLQELEERVDFTERVLARQKDVPRIEGGH